MADLGFREERKRHDEETRSYGFSDAEHTAEVPVNSGDRGRRTTNPVLTQNKTSKLPVTIENKK